MSKMLRASLALILTGFMCLVGGVMFASSASAASYSAWVDTNCYDDAIEIIARAEGYNPSVDPSNHVVFSVDGSVVEDSDFWDGFTMPTMVPNSQVPHTYQVRITAWDDPDGSKGGTVTLTGSTEICVIDTDGDGVPEAEDQCPEEAGPASNNGCPILVDTDGDGIEDELDQCPNEAGPEHNSGCPIGNPDADGDGISDDVDQCPDTPSGTPVDETGCPADTPPGDADGDGVTDDVDQCPNVAGPASNDGCPVEPPADTDGDGVPNDTDDCPSSPGPASNNGCPIDGTVDTDGDGVPDADDECPDTPAGATVDADGCAASQLDTDGDGVNDANDQCPNVAGPASNDGCPVNTDSDGDGVTDDQDKCPGTPPGSTVGLDGCVVEDSDAVTITWGCDSVTVTNERDVVARVQTAKLDETGHVVDGTARDQQLQPGVTLKRNNLSKGTWDVLVTWDDPAAPAGVEQIHVIKGCNDGGGNNPDDDDNPGDNGGGNNPDGNGDNGGNNDNGGNTDGTGDDAVVPVPASGVPETGGVYNSAGSWSLWYVAGVALMGLGLMGVAYSYRPRRQVVKGGHR